MRRATLNETSETMLNISLALLFWSSFCFCRAEKQSNLFEFWKDLREINPRNAFFHRMTKILIRWCRSFEIVCVDVTFALIEFYSFVRGNSSIVFKTTRKSGEGTESSSIGRPVDQSESSELIFGSSRFQTRFYSIEENLWWSEFDSERCLLEPIRIEISSTI